LVSIFINTEVKPEEKREQRAMLRYEGLFSPALATSEQLFSKVAEHVGR